MAGNNPNTTAFDGASYEKHHGQWSRAVGRDFVRWLGLPGGLRWLDVGCGTGAASTVVLAEADPAELVGIDASALQIAYATEHVADGRARFQVGDAQSLTFADGEFDVAVSALVFNLLPDPDKALAEMTRVVRPAGTVATYVWDVSQRGHPSCPLVEGLARLDPKAPRFGAGGSRKVESRSDVVEMFEDGNLTDLVVERFDISVRHDSFDDFWADTLIHQGPQGAFMKGLSPEKLETLREILLETVPTNDAGEVVYPALAWGVRGTVPAA